MIFLLRIIHILFGVVWVGGVFTLSAFILPSARAVGPAAGPMVGQLMQVRQMPKWLVISGFITIGAGFWLYWLASAGANPQWMASGPAKTYGAGAILSVIAWLIGMTVNAPLAKRMTALAAKVAASGAPPTPAEQAQLAAMGSRLGMLGVLVTVLLLLTVVTMAVARYVP